MTTPTTNKTIEDIKPNQDNDQIILKITDAYVAYRDNKINLGELHDSVQALIREARIDELEKLKEAHCINIFDEYTDNRLKQLKENK